MIYLDDLLLLDQNKERLGEHAAIALAVLEALGFLVNYPKSFLIPDQEITFLGFVINFRDKTLSLPQDKGVSTEATSKSNVEEEASVSSQSCPADREDVCIPPSGSTSSPSLLQLQHFPISSKACQDLHWWSQNLSIWNGRLAKDPDPNLIIETDTSKRDWGASCQGVMTDGCWSGRKQTSISMSWR